MLALLLSAFLQAPATSQYPPQQALAPLGIEVCRSPEYSDEEYRAMERVVEIPEARAQFPGSYMFVPASGGVHPGVIALHGSGGGRYTPNMQCNARLLASRGYAALAFCYFDCGVDAIPEALADVDLRRTYDAMVWLKRSRHVGGGKIALMGASRGAEQAALLASLLGHAAKTDSTIVVPNVLYASAPYGRVVGVFNWRRNPDDDRWQQVRPLKASDCWVADPNGRYAGPDGVGRTWVTSLCAAAPSPRTIFDAPAWKWDRDPDRARPGSDIQLQDYQGPILIAHGSIDPVWPVEHGPDHLQRTLERHGVASHREVVAKFEKRVASWPALPAGRVLIYIFEGEPHLYSAYGTVARRQLMLAFFERNLR